MREQKESTETNKSLLIVFFGFMGSKPRHIKKYHQIFNKLQNSLTMHTVYPLRTWTDSFKRQRMINLAKNTLDFTADFIQKQTALDNAPIVMFYTFSNAGAILLAVVTHLLCNDKKYKRMFRANKLFINGIIYESCPGLLKPTLDINHINCGINALLPRIATYPRVIRYLLFSMNYVMAVFFYCMYKIGLFRNDFAINFFDILLCANNWRMLSIPSLFLYSKGDKAVYFKHIQMFIDMKRNALSKYNKQIVLDNFIKTHAFKDSAHVQHYLKHTTEYKRIVLDFLYQVIKLKRATMK